jgi:predicted HTH domain antitoxin
MQNMSLTITLDVPEEIEAKLRSDGPKLNAEVREIYALELYRQGRLDFHELSEMLGLDHIRTSELLQRHRIYRGSITMEDLERDWQTLNDLFKKAK